MASALSFGPLIAQDAPLDEGDALGASAPGISIDDPKTGIIGSLNAWLFYSSEYGVTGGTSGKLNLPSGDGRWVSLGAEIAERRQSLSLAYHQDSSSVGGAAVDVTARGSHQTARTMLPFESTSLGLQGKLTWALGETGSVAGYVGVSGNRAYNADSSLSTLLLPDMRRSERRYVGMDFKRSVDMGDGPMAKLQYTLSGEFASNSTGETQLRGQAGLLTGGYLGGGSVVWRADLRAGTLNTSNGDSSIGERFILGGGSLRGFSYGGFGPHDGNQTLGGNRFALARLDFQFPKGFGKDAWVVPGIHADFGSLWGLDNTGGGLVDDSAKLRGSLGLTLSAKLPNGWLSLSISDAVLKKNNDDTQLFQLGLYTSF